MTFFSLECVDQRLVVENMHDARAISNIFIARSIETRSPITALSLLKILYFAHAWHLVRYDSPLVAQPFEAWKFGPVIRVVYDQIRTKQSKPITNSLLVFKPSEGIYIEAISTVEENKLLLLRNIFDYYAKFDALRLSDLTHEPGSPWDMIWRKAGTGAVPGMKIPDEMIREWFAGESARRSARQKN